MAKRPVPRYAFKGFWGSNQDSPERAQGEPDCREEVRAQLERMKELCEEHNSLSEKHSD